MNRQISPMPFSPAHGTWIAPLSLLLLIVAAPPSLRSATEPLVSLGANWRYLLGTGEASTPSDAWRQPGFNDSAWATGRAPIGYGEGDIVTTIPSSQNGNYLSVYLRTTFTLDDPADFSQVDLTLIVDDGAVAWLNGTELGRINVPAGDLFHDDTAISAQERRTLEASLTENVSSVLRPGLNVLAVHAFNANSTSSDLLLDASLAALTDDVRPGVLGLNPTPTAIVRALTQIEVTFTEPVTNVDAGDLLINGSPAIQLLFSFPATYIFQFQQPPTGTVSVAWSDDPGILDLARTPNAFLPGPPWTYTLDPNAEPPGVIISELMADNDETINDEDGRSSDWIELANLGDLPVNLNGWFLTDDANDPTKWRIPNVTLVPNGYLLIFASGQDRADPAGRLHTNFQLDNSGEYLALLDAQTNVIDVLDPFPSLPTDVSYGSDRANPSVLGYFLEPTPGSPNSSGGPGFGPEVQFSRPSGTFASPFSLELSTPSPTAQIRYTLATNTPTESSTLYSGPITISGTTLVRARSFEPGLLPGPPRSEQFVRLSSDVLGRSSDIPLMILHNYGNGAVPASGSTAEQFVLMQLFEPKANGRSSLTNAPDLATLGRFRRRGATSDGQPMKSYAYESWGEFLDDRAIEPLGLPPESDWVFYAPNNFEPALIHQPLAHRLAREMGIYSPRTRFVEAYLQQGSTVSSDPINQADYIGILVFMEKIKADRNRVDIDRLQPENLAAPSVTGGYLAKRDRADPGESQFSGGGMSSLNWVDPKVEEISTPQRDAQEQYFIGFLNQYKAALDSANFTDPVTGYRRFVNVDSAIDHNIHNVITYNVDAFRLSGYFYKSRDRINDRGELIPGLLHFGPSWDFDRTQGSTDGRDINPRQWRSTGSGDRGTDFFNPDPVVFNNPWYSRMFQDIDFWQTWIDRYQARRQTVWTTTNVWAVIDQYADEIREAAPRHISKWGMSPRYGGWEGEINFKKTWYSNRLDFIDSELLAPPRLSNPEGGSVPAGYALTLSGPPGATLYYTTDGTDPRAPGGSVATSAQSYSGPIVINANARIVARARDLNHRNMTGAPNPPLTSPWSGPAAATFYVQIPSLRITEIMYNPRDPAPGSPYTAQDFEYVEIKNVGSAPVNLVGVQVGGGIEFEFLPTGAIRTLNAGDSVVLVKNQAAFLQRYGPVGNMGGVYLGNLDNGGERLVLKGRFGVPILDFSYNDSWFPVTDGVGFSLVIANEEAPLENWNLPGSWRISSAVHGSPGQNNPPAPSFPAVVINEVLTHTDPPAADAIELFNPTDADVNLQGWFLTDDFRIPHKYAIPPNTQIPAGGYLVFYETNSFNAIPGSPLSFALSSHGDAAYLFSGNGTELTGYAQGFDFGAAPNGATFGRFIVSTGGDQYPLQASPTLGGPNAGPLIGPVVISEIHYHPPDLAGAVDNQEDEYVELHNLTDLAQPLFDAAFPTNTWRLRNAVDYDFPPEVTLGPRGFLLVVSFDPATNAAQLAEWRSRNGVAEAAPIYGPYQGKLDNSSERVELRRPDRPEPAGSPDAGFVPHYLVEGIRYEDAWPWPVAADGLGPSIHRIDLAAYGNDPLNWVAAAKTPGRGYEPGSNPVITAQPSDQTLIAFITNAVLTVEVSPANGPFTYQWLYEGQPIPGATSPVLVLANIEPAQGGRYQVIVANASSAIGSRIATLTVIVPARIIQQPTGARVTPGTNYMFQVAATSSTTIQYQWRKNGVPILDATGPTLTLSNVQPADAGIYDVVLTDAVGPAVSEPAALVVLVEPTIVVQPLGTTNVVGSTIVLSVEVTNTATLPVGFRWRKTGASLPRRLIDSHVDFLVIPTAQISDSGNYTVVVTNEAYFQPGYLSDTAHVTILDQPPPADTDADGLPDDYETAHDLNPNSAADAAQDADGDGVSTLEEYLAGTDPQDPASYLRIEIDLADGQGAARLSFLAQPNLTYLVQGRDQVEGSEWQTVGGAAAMAEARLVEVTDHTPSPLGQRYYRLRTPGFTE